MAPSLGDVPTYVVNGRGGIRALSKAVGLRGGSLVRARELPGSARHVGELLVVAVSSALTEVWPSKRVLVPNRHALAVSQSLISAIIGRPVALEQSPSGRLHTQRPRWRRSRRTICFASLPTTLVDSRGGAPIQERGTGSDHWCTQSWVRDRLGRFAY